MRISQRAILAVSATSLLALSCLISARSDSDAWQKLEEAGTKALHGKNFAEAESKLSAAVKEAEGNDSLLGSSLSELGLAYAGDQKYDQAEESFKRCISVREKSTSSEDKSLIPPLNNLASVYLSQKRLPDAHAAYDRVLKLSETNFGADHPSVALALNNLANVLISESGPEKEAKKLAEAEQLLKRSLPIWEKSYGANHAVVAKCLDNLGSVCANENKLDEAQQYYNRALAIRSSEKPAEATPPAERALSLNKMAQLYRAKGQFEQAEPLLKEILQIAQGSDDLAARNGDQTQRATSLTNLAVASNNLSMLYRELARFNEAEDLYRRALDIRVDLADHYAGKSEDLARSYDNLGSLYVEEEKYDQAEPMYKKALEIREKAEGAEGVDVRLSLNNLANLARDRGDLTEAVAYAKRSLDIAEKQKISDKDLNVDMTNLALLYREQGDQQQTGDLFKKIVDLDKQGLDVDPVVKANNLNNLARFYRDSGQYEQAETLYKQSLALREQALGPDNPQVGASLRNYAILLRKLNRNAEAEQLDRRAEKIEDRTEVDATR